MRPRQVLVLITALLLAALDGYDALSMAFVAPVLALEWGISKSIIGLLLSSSLLGMAIGAIALSPLADRLGRRTVVLTALAIMILGTTLSALAGSVPLLAAARLLTGIGIGVMVAMTTLLSAEFSKPRVVWAALR
jgi:MFS family permease